MEDIEKDEENTINIKIMNLTCTINKKLPFIKRSDDEELVFSNEDSEIIIKTGEDLMNFIKNYFNVPYKKLKLLCGSYTIYEDDEISDIIPRLENEELPCLIILEDKDIEDNESNKMTLFLKTTLSYEESELSLEEEATLLNLKEKIKYLIHVEIDDQIIKFNEEEISDNNKKLRDYGIENDCTIKMELKEKDEDIDDLFQESKKNGLLGRKEYINFNNPEFDMLRKIYNIDEKLKDPKMLDLLSNPKYEEHFGINSGTFLVLNDEQLKNAMEIKDLIDKGI